MGQIISSEEDFTQDCDTVGAGKNKSVQGRADRNRVDTKLEERHGGGCQVNDGFSELV